ncbi:MAG TPA: hypothetical protein VLC46_12390 [Thermoanaerobaculia bacterium]|nr:hypothetical protein [Thermoanaerobaculia bacterium]
MAMALSTISDLLIEKENLFRAMAMALLKKKNLPLDEAMASSRHHRSVETTSMDRFSLGGSLSEKEKTLSQKAMAISRNRISFSMKPWRHHVTKIRLTTTSMDRFSLVAAFRRKEECFPQRAMALPQGKKMVLRALPWFGGMRGPRRGYGGDDPRGGGDAEETEGVGCCVFTRTAALKQRLSHAPLKASRGGAETRS